MKKYIGCSGFHYSDWKGKFYPDNLPKKKWLEFYSEKFNTVEINNTFYKMPEKKSIDKWIKETPAGFKFTIKANRYFTHQKKLNIDDDFKDRFHSFTEVLGNMETKLGSVLWQLPGNLHKNTEKLEKLCKLFDKSSRNVLEFRHKSWFDEEVYKVLSENDVSICMLSAPGDLPEQAMATSKLAYLRLHGKKEWYNYNYSEDELKNWATRLKKLKDADELFVYFNNDQHAHAPENAKTLQSMFRQNND